MLPGTKFYYDRNGRYRGKSSDIGPVTHAVWSFIGLALVGVFVLNVLIENWWFFALILAAFALLASIVGLILAAKGRQSPALMVAFFIVSAAATGSLVYFELLPELAASERAPAEARQPASAIVQDRGVQNIGSDSSAHPGHIDPSGAAPSAPIPLAQSPAGPVSSAQPEGAASSQPQTTSDPAALTGQKADEQANSQTFNCRRTTESAEKLICSDQNLLDLDAQLGALYQRALDITESPLQVRYAQQSWVYNKRNQCSSRACLTEAYTKRISELSEIAGR